MIFSNLFHFSHLYLPQFIYILFPLSSFNIIGDGNNIDRLRRSETSATTTTIRVYAVTLPYKCFFFHFIYFVFKTKKLVSWSIESHAKNCKRKRSKRISKWNGRNTVYKTCRYTNPKRQYGQLSNRFEYLFIFCMHVCLCMCVCVCFV